MKKKQKWLRELRALNATIMDMFSKYKDRTPIHIQTRKNLSKTSGISRAVSVNGFIMVYKNEALTELASPNAKEGFVPKGNWEAYKEAHPSMLDGNKPEIWEVTE